MTEIPMENIIWNNELLTEFCVRDKTVKFTTTETVAQILDRPTLRRSCPLELNLLHFAHSITIIVTRKPLEMSPPKAKSATATRKAATCRKGISPEYLLLAHAAVRVNTLTVVELRWKVQVFDL